jgi:hypothetical protein
LRIEPHSRTGTPHDHTYHRLAADGSLTFAFGPKQPDGVPQANWLPTPEGKKYDMTYRFYGPASDLVSGKYYPPALMAEH